MDISRLTRRSKTRCGGHHATPRGELCVEARRVVETGRDRRRADRAPDRRGATTTSDQRRARSQRSRFAAGMRATWLDRIDARFGWKRPPSESVTPRAPIPRRDDDARVEARVRDERLESSGRARRFDEDVGARDRGRRGARLRPTRRRARARARVAPDPDRRRRRMPRRSRARDASTSSPTTPSPATTTRSPSAIPASHTTFTAVSRLGARTSRGATDAVGEQRRDRSLARRSDRDADEARGRARPGRSTRAVSFDRRRRPRSRTRSGDRSCRASKGESSPLAARRDRAAQHETLACPR